MRLQFKDYVSEIDDREGVFEYNTWMSSRDGKTREKRKILRHLKWSVGCCGDRGREVVTGDLNARVGSRKVWNVIGKFGVQGMNEN